MRVPSDCPKNFYSPASRPGTNPAISQEMMLTPRGRRRSGAATGNPRTMNHEEMTAHFVVISS
jgi:hypothetical protein